MGPSELIIKVGFEVPQKVAAVVKGRPGRGVIEGEGSILEGRHSADPVSIGEVNGDNEGPKVV